MLLVTVIQYFTSAILTVDDLTLVYDLSLRWPYIIFRVKTTKFVQAAGQRHTVS